MRSVVKLLPGQTTATGTKISTDYNPYGKAKKPLVENLGNYCSYCERQLPASKLDVEHIVPKALHPDKTTQWTNFLLGCSNCNVAKSDKPVTPQSHFFPHAVNTFAVFDGRFGSNPGVRSGLAQADKIKAEATLLLLRLDRNATTKPAATEGDDRHLYRMRASSIVSKYLEKWESGRMEPDVIVDLAIGYGYWSIWMDAFAAYPAVQDALIAAFPGTYPDCRNGQITRP